MWSGLYRTASGVKLALHTVSRNFSQLNQISMSDTPMFDLFIQADTISQKAKEQSDLEQRIEEHRKSLKICWPEWNGPVIDSNSIDGYCSVNTCIVYSITHQENRYHYMAPCKIVSISNDGLNIKCEVEYPKGSSCEHYNGERLQLHFLEIWAPTSLINKHR